MQKINLLEEIVVVQRDALLQAFTSFKEFGITYRGDIVYEPFGHDDILIFQSTKVSKSSTVAPHKNLTIEQMLGREYRVVEEQDSALIKASGAWQQIIQINQKRADYDDTSADGIGEFSDDELESIGWHCAEFNISYRELVDVLEEQCDVTLLCIEQEEPYQFSGLGFIHNKDSARSILYKYCRDRAEKAIEEDSDLDKDGLEAAEFFNLTVPSDRD